MLIFENVFKCEFIVQPHSDFFKNNMMFKNTRPESIIQRLRAAKKRIQGYVENQHIGIDNVEKVEKVFV